MNNILLDSRSRPLPVSLDAERSVISAILIDPEAMQRVRDLLSAEDFYDSVYRLLWETFCDLDDREIAVNLTSTVNR